MDREVPAESGQGREETPSCGVRPGHVRAAVNYRLMHDSIRLLSGYLALRGLSRDRPLAHLCLSNG